MAHSVSYTREDSSGMSYIEGVPMKIGDLFLLPPKVTLPIKYQQWNPSEILNVTADYDFSLEEKVVAWAEAQRNAKQVLAQAQANQAVKNSSASDGEDSLCASDDSEHAVFSTMEGSAGAGDAMETGDTDSNAVNSNVSPSALPSSPRMRMDAGLLQPVPAKPVQKTANDSTKHTLINLEDFENNTDPFDSAELKTINDIEELKNVLEGPAPARYVSPVTGYRANAQALSGSFDSYYGEHHAAGFSAGQVLPPISSRDVLSNQPINTGVQSEYHNAVVSDSRPSTSTVLPSTYQPFQPASSMVSAISSSNASGVSSTPTNSFQFMPSDTAVGTSQYSQYFLQGWGHESPSRRARGSFGSGSAKDLPLLRPLVASKSTPDISQENGDITPVEQIRSKSRSPPPRPSSVGSVKLQAWNPYDPLPPTPYTLTSQQPYSRHSAAGEMHEPNPYAQLSSNAQCLVDRLTDMGFSRALTSRAVQKIGTDDKKVVDHLCQVNVMVEKGVSSMDAEEGLHLFDQNTSKATEYVKLKKQFLDLGFEESAIKQALVDSSLDRDKALDSLCA